MAVTIGNVAAALADTLVSDSSVTDASGVQANSGATTLYCVKGDGTSTTSTSYIKAWDATSGSPDSNNPDYIFPVPAGTSVEYVSMEGNALASGLRYWGTSTRANGSTQAPTVGTLTAKILLS
mgnify:CR=1 FL=1|tara:strand:- start:1056 stop:1424 length:369 start_codon:yes stop_codon:yes gene_type:complete